jgi:hypothetical protein
MAKARTAAQRAALKKAQAVSARKRRGHFSRNKRKYAVAAAAVGYVAYQRTKKKPYKAKSSGVSRTPKRVADIELRRASRDIKRENRRKKRVSARVKPRALKAIKRLSRKRR